MLHYFFSFVTFYFVTEKTVTLLIVTIVTNRLFRMLQKEKKIYMYIYTLGISM